MKNGQRATEDTRKLQQTYLITLVLRVKKAAFLPVSTALIVRFSDKYKWLFSSASLRVLNAP